MSKPRTTGQNVRLTVPETGTRRAGNGDSPSSKQRLAVVGIETRLAREGQPPARDFSASARSVDSHGSSMSVRPKCPYAAVGA